MNRLAIWLGSILVIAAVLAIGGTLGWIKYKEITAAMTAEPPPVQPIGVTFADASNVEYQYNTTVIGTVIAPQSIMLSNEIAGTVIALNFDSGQEVDANQKLVELDSSVERAQLKSAVARLKMAQSTLTRTKQAATNRAVSELEVEEAESVFAQANAEIAQLEAIIARKTLVAPFKARIGLRNTHLGQFLPSGSQIVMLQSIDDYVFVDFMVSQDAADSIKLGSPVELIDESGTYQAEIAAIDSQADRSTRNLMLRAKLSPVPSQLQPGESVRVLVKYGPVLNTPAVPVEAVRRAPMRAFVYLVEQDPQGNCIARERTVTVGQMVGDRFSILSGIESGERVVAVGSFKLREGVAIVDIGKSSELNTAPANPTAGPQETAGK